MKKIFVPLIDKEICIHVGKDEWGKFVKMARKLGFAGKDEVCPEGDHDGRAFGSAIWVATPSPDVVFHEVAHFISALHDVIGCEGEEEFKAYIAEDVYTKVHKWLNEINKE